MTDWIALEEEHLLPTYAKLPISLEKGQGSWVTAGDGKDYLDFYGGHAVCALGHSPEAVTTAITAQAKSLLFYSNLVYSPIRARAARALVSLCGTKGSKVFFCNSGAEANENAMKIARLATGRRVIIATEDSFHGRTAGAWAATGLNRKDRNPDGLGADIIHVPFDDLAAAEAALGPDTAGFILEPIQSLKGIITPSLEYLEGLERLCRDRGTYLIFDEVQTGLGRLGAPSAASAFGIHPDLQTFAKALGSGVPCGAVLAAPGAGDRLKTGDLGTTFGGGPLACAAIEATLEEILSLKLWENARAMGDLIIETFTFEAVKAIRGQGLLLGLVLDRPAKTVRDALLGKGIITGTSAEPDILRLMPPLNITAEDVAILRTALGEILTEKEVRA